MRLFWRRRNTSPLTVCARSRRHASRLSYLSMLRSRMVGNMPAEKARDMRVELEARMGELAALLDDVAEALAHYPEEIEIVDDVTGASTGNTSGCVVGKPARGRQSRRSTSSCRTGARCAGSSPSRAAALAPRDAARRAQALRSTSWPAPEAGLPRWPRSRRSAVLRALWTLRSVRWASR